MDSNNIVEITANIIDTAQAELKSISTMLENHLKQLEQMRDECRKSNSDEVTKAALVASYNKTYATLKSLRS